jgi:hypothetical protein
LVSSLMHIKTECYLLCFMHILLKLKLLDNKRAYLHSQKLGR